MKTEPSKAGLSLVDNHEVEVPLQLPTALNVDLVKERVQGVEDCLSEEHEYQHQHNHHQHDD